MIAAGIDAGTQSIKVIVYDSSSKEIIASHAEPLELIVGEGGVREQKASWWTDAVRKCFLAIPADIRKRIGVISVSGQQHGFVPVAADGSVLYSVKLWCDTSTAPECYEIEEKLGGRKALSERIGNPILPGYTASKILWFRKNHPDLYEKMATVMLPHDYLNFYLTGERVMERGDASGTGLMDIFTGTWDKDAVAAISPDLIDKLPPILPEPGIIGKVKSETASELGLSEDCSVASGGGDNMMSAIGTGAVADGAVTMSLGTSGTLFSSVSHAFHDKENRLASFCSSHGTWLPLLCTMNCTVASEIMRGFMGFDVKAFDGEAEKAPIGSEGLMMLPFFNGERIPDLPDGKGVLFGMTPDNVKAGNIARATLEGVTFEFLLGLEAFRENGIAVDSITLTGGGSKSPFWRQLVADMSGCPVRVPVSSEAAALGSALQGLWLMKGGEIADVVSENIVFDDSKSALPDKGNHEKYMKLYEKWHSLVDASVPMFSV